MAGYSAARTIECFHLAFLEVLRVRLDPARYVLKGGANLRYFFDSARYSEDIDLDVLGVAGRILENKVDGVLSSQPLEFILRSTGLAVVATDITKPKQTDTTATLEGADHRFRAERAGADQDRVQQPRWRASIRLGDRA